MPTGLKRVVKSIPFLGPALVSMKRSVEHKEFPGSGNYWEARYRTGRTSGSGSYGRLATFKAEFLNVFISEHTISSVVELGCGDGNQLTLAQYPNYVGLDVSQTAVEKCRAMFADRPQYSFFLVDDYSTKTELSLSLDVIYHLVEDSVFNGYMKKLFALGQKWVIIYASNGEYPELNAAHVRHRKFTDWVDANAKGWKLQKHVPNKYPYDPSNADESSFADFFIYEKI